MPVHGIGPTPCAFMVVGSEPGYREVRAGEPFVGPTGEELMRLLSLCGLKRSQVFLTNIYREPKDDHDAEKNAALYTAGVAALRGELRRVKPAHIITLGREAARLFLGDVDMEDVWGLHLSPRPMEGGTASFRDASIPLSDLTWNGIVPSIFAQTHPAAGFHSPDASSQVLVGFENMRRALRAHERPRALFSDPITHPVYRELTTDTAVASWMVGAEEFACDTEGYNHAPWSLQLTKRAGEGVLVRANNTTALREARLWIARAKRVTMHSGLHDLSVLRQMGVDLIEHGVAIDDTQLMAYLLGVIPQGLKALAVRELGMPMQSYGEVLGDAQDRHARVYLEWLWEDCNLQWQRMREEDFAFQREVLKRRIKVLPKLPKSRLHKAVERVLASKEPARLWSDQLLDIQVEAHARLGAMPEASLSDVDASVALRYAGRDPDATFRLRDALWPRIVDMELEGVYALDIGTYPILDRMMQVGIRPDIGAFATLATKLDGELTEILRALRTAVDAPEFNPNSGDQVAEFIFGALGLENPGRRTSSGRDSTNDKILEALEKAHPEHPEIADIRSYREYYKLRHTFVARLPDLTKRWPHDGRIHCELMLTRTPSGRLAAKNPNLLAMPKHGKFAKDFRRCFVPGEGRSFVSADESQIELRVLAHLSQDPVMCAIFRGETRNPDGSLIDLHAAMAQRIFGVAPKDQDESKHRLPSKAVNFGLPMGMTAVGLCLELRKGGLDVSEDDAQRWIDEADQLYAAVPHYKAACVAEATQRGYVRCLSGRIRYIGGIRSRDERVRAEAERFAFSTKIQEGAQTIGKGVLAEAWREVFVPLRKAGYWIEPILWIHDDLLSEMDDELVPIVAPLLREILTTAPGWFSIPLMTKPESGKSWADMKKVLP